MPVAPTTPAIAPRRRSGNPHDHHEQAEDHGLDVGHGLEHGLAGLPHGLQRETDEQRHEQGLQDVSRGQ